jgi:hypothetical protein
MRMPFIGVLAWVLPMRKVRSASIKNGLGIYSILRGTTDDPDSTLGSAVLLGVYES